MDRPSSQVAGFTNQLPSEQPRPHRKCKATRARVALFEGPRDRASEVGGFVVHNSERRLLIVTRPILDHVEQCLGVGKEVVAMEIAQGGQGAFGGSRDGWRHVAHINWT